MNFRAFNNYMNTVQNGIDAAYNHHPENTKKVFEENGLWARHLLERVFCDKDHNILRWLDGKDCVYTDNRHGHKITVKIGDDREALYYFLMFCKKINQHKEVDEVFMRYLYYLILRSKTPEGWDEC